MALDASALMSWPTWRQAKERAAIKAAAKVRGAALTRAGHDLEVALARISSELEMIDAPSIAIDVYRNRICAAVAIAVRDAITSTIADETEEILSG